LPYELFCTTTSSKVLKSVCEWKMLTAVLKKLLACFLEAFDDDNNSEKPI